jgi:transposase
MLEPDDTMEPCELTLKNSDTKYARAVDEGMPRDEIVERFLVSRATIKRYLKRRRETGDVLQRPIPGRPKVKGMALQAQLAHQLTANPGATLAARSGNDLM